MMNKHPIAILLFLLFALPLSAEAKQPALNRTVIEAHQVKGPQVFGKYAIVKLPIDKGVTLWNPVAITKNADGVIYVANHIGGSQHNRALG